jgi:penicillin-binding protein 1C
MERIRKSKWIIGILMLVSISYFFALPNQLFHDPYSTVIEDKSGQLLSASIAADGQWRFPQQNRLPKKFAQAIIQYEDKRFHQHFGVDLLSFGRAIKQNLQAGKVISGGSTLTMQTIRLSRKNRSRTFFEKAVEVVLATRLEFRFSKDEILSLYASHAPFGGNVVGLEAACWRYFGRKSDELSWAEASLLAVLPNNPSLIHVSKNRDKLKIKRDRLLERLFKAGKLDSLSVRLAKEEPLPESPLSLPQLAPHLLTFAQKNKLSQQKISSSLEVSYQKRCIEILKDHSNRLRGNKINNAAILIAEVNSGKVLAYVGNNASGAENNEQVDLIQSPRSSGSILKPFLYAALLDDGKMLPHTLQPDVPTFINGFAPENFSHELDGAVPASQALIRSLNIPAVHELRSYRYEKFYELLKKVGFTTLQKPPDHYGLSLILGGAEVKLWDVAAAYASMARSLNEYFNYPGKKRYRKGDFHPLTFLQHDSIPPTELEEATFLSASASYLTFNVLKELYRPGEESGWRLFNGAQPIAWKTGTSHGFRDAWALGVNKEYVIGIWVGNADGEGRPGLTGNEAAAPILFDVLAFLPKTDWFQKPIGELEKIPTCAKSGYRIGEYCETVDTVFVVRSGLESRICPYHRSIHVSKDQRFSLHEGCTKPTEMIKVNWFVLPSVQEYYFRKKHASYRQLPPYRADCQSPQSIAQIDLIYPQPDSQVFIPKELDGSLGKIILEATSRNPKNGLHWHMDGVYLKTTYNDHRWAISLKPGSHKIALVDDSGEVIERFFWIYSK